jgi:queuine tRNA-ribosyltransferase
MQSPFAFSVQARDGNARTGRLETPHGAIETPAFMPVATYGAVRGVAPDELADVGAQVLLANTFHLHERPGEAIVASLGGLHGFTGWSGPWLTDSGGYQVWSLADGARVDESGVTFASPVDGARRLLTPERAMQVQEDLGADIWSERARRAHRRPDQLLFGIVQGGASEALRRESARQTRAIGFEGFAHGGLGLGEDARRRCDLVGLANQELPPEAPRYLMGLGRPSDLLQAIAAGVDLFDCVLPTRHARHGVIFTSEGLVRLRNARHRDAAAPPDPDCDCTTCARFSRAYLRHLLRSGEALGGRLASVHNLRFYQRLMQQARDAIRAGSLAALVERIVALRD